jgi:hypothetical protein
VPAQQDDAGGAQQSLTVPLAMPPYRTRTMSLMAAGCMSLSMVQVLPFAEDAGRQIASGTQTGAQPAVWPPQQFSVR